MKYLFMSIGKYTLCFFLSLFWVHFAQSNTSIQPNSSTKKSVYFQQTIKGIVKDANGNPIPFANIFQNTTNNWTTTLEDGTFSIVAKPNDVLTISFIGFKSKTITIEDTDNLEIVLQENITQLEGVEVNAGYYKTSKASKTGSISKVSKENISNQIQNNPLEALQGRIAGAQIIPSSGVVGASMDIVIRGQNSIRSNANSPLFIIDGVPYDHNAIGSPQTSGSILPGGGYNPLNFLNASNIESIEILKDADATAIYGSRGANGVVLITTKKGEAETSKFQIQYSTTLGTLSKQMDLLSTSQYVALRKEAYNNDGIAVLPFNAYDINGTWSEDKHTNWQQTFLGNTAYIHDAAVGFQGGNSQTKYRISGNWQEQSTLYGQDFNADQISGLASLHHQSKDNSFQIAFSTNYAVNSNNLLSMDLVRDALRLAPNAPNLFQEDGSLNWENNTWNNPYAALESQYHSNGSNLISNASIAYTPMKNVSTSVNLGYTKSDIKEIRTLPSTMFNPTFGLNSSFSSAIHHNSERNSWIVEPKLQWSPSFGKIKIEGLIGATFQQKKQKATSVYARGFSNNSLIENTAVASTINILSDVQSTYKYHAVFGRLNFQYAHKLFLNLTARRDGSSRFGSNKRFANFGAIGAAWVFSKEKLFNNQNVLSFGKLRASYGTSGNDQIGDYQYLDTYSFGNSKYQSITILQPTGLYNPNFSWESNKKAEVALELGFFKNRIYLQANYFQNRSSNQLVGIPLSTVTGFSSLNANLDATIENKGFELELQFTPLQSKKWQWQSSFNMTFLRNKLLEFPNLEGSTYANTLAIGQPLNILKVYAFKGVDPQTGLYTFKDVNGDGLITPTEDKQTIKDLNPDFFGGFENIISYKNLKLQFLFNFAKQQGYNYYASSSLLGSMANQPKEVLDRWQQPGDIATHQRATAGFNPQAVQAYSNYIQSDAVISDASFIRLKQVGLQYQLPKKIIKHFDCNLYLRGYNLWTITNYFGLDPEIRSNTTLPALKQWSLGATLTF